MLRQDDNIIVIRDEYIFTAALDEIMRSLDDIIEYRIKATRNGELDKNAIEVADTINDAQRIADKLETCLGLHVPVTCVTENTLPRSDGKSKRFIDLRDSTT